MFGKMGRGGGIVVAPHAVVVDVSQWCATSDAAGSVRPVPRVPSPCVPLVVILREVQVQPAGPTRCAELAAPRVGLQPLRLRALVLTHRRGRAIGRRRGSYEGRARKLRGCHRVPKLS